MSGLNAYKDTGEILFDTNLISYGLVKSGYMVFLGGWTRKTLRSAQLDPNDGSNWFPSSFVGDTSFADGIWGFTVYNPISPIVFLTGSGCLMGSAVGAGYITYYYANASVNTRFYCFDLMADNFAGSTYLKTWDASGRLTFNSLQPPLNILAAIQAPTPGALDQFGRYTTTYVGGANRIRQSPSGPLRAQTDSYIDIALGGEEYAAYLPWSRTCGTYDFLAGGTSLAFQYGMAEGCYGYAGGITFMFGASAATTEARPSTQGWSSPISFFNLPIDRYPVALVIRTSDLIFPYN